MTAPTREQVALRLLREGYSPSQVTERTGLSREALDALAGKSGERRRDGSSITELPIRVLSAHPENIRDDLGDLHELAATIREHGVLQPLLVTRCDLGTYLVLDGHRRLGAAITAGLVSVPVRMHVAVDEADATVLMLVTGLQKLALDPMDEAIAYQRLERHGYRPVDIARLVGKNPGHVSQRMALLNLTPAEQAAVRRREITIDAGYRAGRERSDRRRTGEQRRPKPRRVPHFTKAHPLASTAAARCGHETTLKLGVACGPCWEAVIRDDVLALFNSAQTETPPQEVR